MMELLLSPSKLLNAAGALVFFGVGLAILVVGRSSQRGQRVGAFATLFGLAFVVENLYWTTRPTTYQPPLWARLRYSPSWPPSSWHET